MTMRIKILGSGCSNCHELEKNAKAAIAELGMEAEIEKITDMEKIMGYGVMSLPAMIVDEKISSYGSVPQVDEIKKLLTGAKISSDDSDKGCCCGRGCC